MPGRRSWLFQLLREASYRLRPFWYSCGRDFGTICNTPSFDLELDLDVDLEGQMSGQRSWLHELLREATCRLRPFWYSCGCNFGTISGIPSFDLEVNLEGHLQGQRSWFCQLLRGASYRLRPFWYSSAARWQKRVSRKHKVFRRAYLKFLLSLHYCMGTIRRRNSKLALL